MTPAAVHHLVVYVPAAHAGAVKVALFAAGAGRIGGYDCCCWQTAGTGQFRPLAGSHPAIGTAGGGVETVPEIKIEMVCRADLLPAVIAALRKAHPYETPAFFHWPVDGITV